MKTSVIEISSAKAGWLRLLEHMTRIHPVLTFIFLTFALPLAMLGAVAGGVVLLALPFTLLL